MKDKIIWMPHPGHFIVAYDCKFILNTYVNGYIVSTVGEYTQNPAEVFEGDKRMENIGWDIERNPMFYETMIFKARKTKAPCCPYEAIVTSDDECIRYKTSAEAFKGHYEWIERKVTGNK